MTSVFLYEFITGGGLLADETPPPVSLLREGRAMVRALAADLASIPGFEVLLMRDRRLGDVDSPGGRVSLVGEPEEERATFLRLAAEADFTLVIAPEFDRSLQTRAEWALSAGSRLLSPRTDLIALTADKQRLAEHLRHTGVPTPVGRMLAPGESLPPDFSYPAVVKPVDGCGSLGVRLVANPGAPIPQASTPRRLEPFYPGLAVSVAALCGPAGNTLLPPCCQHLADDGSFAYLGGSLPLPDVLADRAQRLAARAIDTLPAPLGYVGVDLVLGDDPEGARDVVIEINPRLTTSYVGLRAATDANLAAAMLAVANGQSVSLSFTRCPIHFESDGTVHDESRTDS